MKKNVAGQVVGAQVCSAADGSDFAGSVTVYVTGDGGTQATGSVGAGACTNEGNGFYTYAPAQAETNFDHVAFTFKGTGAITSTVQVYTSFPQTGDSFGRLGAPAGASVSADIAGVQSDTNDIQTRIPAALVSGRMDASVGAMSANTMTASALAADAVAEIQSGLSTLDAAGVRAAVGLATADLDTQLAALPTATENADAMLNRDMGAVSDTNARSPLNALRFLRNKWSISGSTLSVTKENDADTAWTAVVSTTPGADPVTGNDPA